MIRSGTYVQVVDKSGARAALVVRVLRNLEIGRPGSVAIVVIKDALPKRKKKKKFAKKGDVFPALILTNKISICRKTHYYVNFAANTVILLKKNEKDPTSFSNRMVGPVPRELRYQGLMRIISMASNVF